MNVEELKKDNKVLAQHNKRLVEENENLKKMINQYDMTLVENITNAVESRNGSETFQQELLDEFTVRIHKKEDTIKNLYKENKILANKLKEINDTVSITSNSVSEKFETLHLALNEANYKIKSLVGENNALKNIIREMEISIDTLKDEYQCEVSELNQSKNKLEDDINRAKAEYSAQMTGLMNDFEVAKSKKDTLISILQTNISEITKDSIKKLNYSNLKLEKVENKLKHKTEEYESQLKQLNNKIHLMELQHKNSEEKYVEELKTHSMTLEEMNNKMLEDKAKYEKQLTVKQDRIEQLLEEKVQIINNNNSKPEKKSSIQNKNTSRLLNENTNKISKLESKIEALDGLVESYKIEKERLENELTRYLDFEAKYNDIFAKLLLKNKDYNILFEDHCKLSERIQELIIDNNDLNYKINKRLSTFDKVQD